MAIYKTYTITPDNNDYVGIFLMLATTVFEKMEQFSLQVLLYPPHFYDIAFSDYRSSRIRPWTRRSSFYLYLAALSGNCPHEKVSDFHAEPTVVWCAEKSFYYFKCLFVPLFLMETCTWQTIIRRVINLS